MNNIEDTIKPLNIPNNKDINKEIDAISKKSLNIEDTIKPLNIVHKNEELIKPLNIPNKDINKEIDTISKKSSNVEIKPLNINNEIKNINNDDKKFDLSYQYIKNKIDNLNPILYEEIKIIMSMISRKEKDNHDNEILKYGKIIQEKISDSTIMVADNNGSNLINEINNSHQNIINNIYYLDKEETFSEKIKFLFFKKNEVNTEIIKNNLKLEMDFNKNKELELENMEKILKNYKEKIMKLEFDLNLYIKVGELLSEELKNEGYEHNQNLIEKRLLSLKKTNLMLQQSKSIIELHINKIILNIEIIINVVNILIPNLINKLSLNNINDQSYNDLKNEILNNLNKGINDKQ